MKKIKASILIANYNNQKYILDCINSLLKQDFEDKFEIIFHDDNSDDKSLNIIRQFKNIKIIKNKKKTKFGSYNQMDAVRRSLYKSKGEIIFLLDSDDYFKKKKIKILIELFNKNKSLDVVFDLPIIKEGKKIIFSKNKIKNFQRFWSYIPPQSCITLRRKVFKKILQKINFKKFPDIWMDFRIAIYSKYILNNFFILEKNLTIYRRSSTSASYKFKKFSSGWWLRRFQAHEYLKYFFKKNNINFNKNIDYIFTSFLEKILR